ncbi:MAG: SDR family oxidoreductase [Anaerolineales bacterium]|nr:SDR family oxidoreductase [Anaerolineales bacterium]
MARSKDYWQGKIALITGGSSGIGLAVARSLAEKGAHVWLLARGLEGLKFALESLKCHEDQHCGMISADVSDWDQVSSAVIQVESEIGVPDLVVNSAGVAHPGYFQDLGVEIFHWMMDVNYFGTVYVCKSVVPGMVARGSGHIVNISSGAGLIGRYGYTAYGATKYAVRGFTDVLRSELKPLGINVSLVFPPDTDTPQLAYEKEYLPPEAKALAGIASLISPTLEDMSTLMSPEEVADSIMLQVERGRYIILPGFEIKLLFWLSRFLGSGIYPILDWLIARAQRDNQQGD